MPHINDMLAGRFLKKEDVPKPVLVTVRSLKKTNVAMTNEEPELKWTMQFDEFEQPLVMNPTNIQLAAAAMESDDTDDWIGRQLVLYVDPTVAMGGKLVGGLRLRAPKRAAPRAEDEAPPPPPPPKRPSRAAADMDDDIPF